METRELGSTGRTVGVIGLGTWQLGADWGNVDEDEALSVITAAVDSGVTFLDTADVYGDGRSERVIGRWLREHPGSGVTVATKIGRRADPVLAASPPPPCPPGSSGRAPTSVWRRSTWCSCTARRPRSTPPTPSSTCSGSLVADKAIASYGVSVETCAEALTAIARPGVSAVQIVFNALRQKPLDEVLPAAADAGVAIIARVPLASGLLSGKYDESTTFGADDHRHYNRHGEAFDQGETFAGIPYEIGLQAVRELAPIVPPGETIAQFALRWVIDQPGVSVVIPGARNTGQAQETQRRQACRR